MPETVRDIRICRIRRIRRGIVILRESGRGVLWDLFFWTIFFF